MSVTLKDIAKELNLSATAVSRALRDMSDISPETKALVKETAERLGYRKNFAAQYLKTNKSMMFGMVVADICNPVFSFMYKGVEKVCKENGYTVMLGNSNENSDEESVLIENMLNHGVEGVFLVPSMKNEKILSQLEEAHIPYVSLQRKFEGYDANYIQSDDFKGGYMAARHLYGLGHRKFLYVSAPMHISSAKERYKGFLEYLSGKKISKDSVQVLECDGTRAGSYKVMKKWLDKGEKVATAVFCFSDYVAYGVYSAMEKMQLRIPEDFSVVGYDNNEYSDIIVPGLTTIDMRTYRMGKQAAQMMIDLIHNKENAAHFNIVTTPELVVRGSTK